MVVLEQWYGHFTAKSVEPSTYRSRNHCRKINKEKDIFLFIKFTLE